MSEMKVNSSFDDLFQTIKALKSENILLKDKLMVSKQQNVVLNHIRNESLKCLEVLETIVHRLDTKLFEYQNEDIDGSVATIDTIDVEECDTDLNCDLNCSVVEPIVVTPEPQPQPVPEEELNASEDKVDVIGCEVTVSANPNLSAETVEELKDNYYRSCHQLNDWMKQLEEIHCIQSYPRFVVTQCHSIDTTPESIPQDRSFVRRSIRASIPVAHYNPIEERDLFKKLSTEDIERLAKERTQTNGPKPKYGLTSHNGVLSLKHVGSDDQQMASTSAVNSQPEIKVEDSCEIGLSCPHPNCAYITRHGNLKDNLKRHLKRCHKRMKGLSAGLTQSIQNREKTSNQIRSTLAVWGKSTLKHHFMARNSAPAVSKPNVLSNSVFLKQRNVVKRPKPMVAILRCTKCNFKANRLSHLKKHLTIHNRELPFKCVICDASYSQNQKLRQHMKLCHNLTVPSVQSDIAKYEHKCSDCSRVFRWPSDLRRHKCRKQSPEINKFPVVEENPTPEAAVDIEVIAIPDDDPSPVVRTYQCPHEDCDFTTYKMGSLQKHVIIHIFKKKSEANEDSIHESIDGSNIGSNDLNHQSMKKEVKSEKTANNSRQTVNGFDSTPTQYSSAESETRRLRIRKQRVEAIASSPETARIESRIQTPLSNRLIQSLFKCDSNDCEFKSNSFEEWVKHNDWHQNTGERNKRFKCLKCHKSYTKLSLLKAHQRLKRHKTYDCLSCDEMFTNETNLKIHIMAAHSADDSHLSSSVIHDPQEPNVCDFPDCGKVFVLLKNKLIHMKNVHKASAPDGSSHLMLGSELLNRLTSNTMSDTTAETVEIRCPYVKCKKAFPLRALMINHFNKSHKQIQDFQSIVITDESSRCQQCGQLFNNVTNMRRHHTLAHINGSKRKTLDNISAINPELFNPSIGQTFGQNEGYLCQRNGCGKWFQSALQLRDHLNEEHNRVSDTIDNPFLCQMCRIDLPNAEALELHFRFVHSHDVDRDSVPDSEQQVIPDLDMSGVEDNDLLFEGQYLLGDGMSSQQLSNDNSFLDISDNIDIKYENIFN